MGFATVADLNSPHSPNPNHLHLDSLPLIDLRLLSQSDLYSLSLTSFSSSSYPTRRFDDDVLIPKIDRSVFNESAGSRKQTYSRLRLAPRNSQFPIPQPKSKPQPASHSHSRDPETFQIISLLKQLFPSETTATQNDDVALDQKGAVAPGPTVINATISLPVDVGSKRKRGRPRKDANAVTAYPTVNDDVSINETTPGVARPSNDGKRKRGRSPIVNADASIDETTPGFVIQGSDGKRRRGPPLKEESRAVSSSGPEKKASVKEVEEWEMVMENESGVVVDLGALANDADASFAEALSGRTEGMETEAQLLGFLGGLEGEWSSARKKRKIVRAGQLSNVLPIGWRILLSLKRNEGHVWLYCRRYISPNGQQFVSCKEVSSYLVSYFGVGNQSKRGRTDGSVQVSNKMVSCDGMQHDTNLAFEDESKANELVSCSLMSGTSISTGHEKQETFLHTENSREIPAGEAMGMPKKLDPVKTGVLQKSLKIHESVQIDREPSSDAIANNDNSDFPRAQVNKGVNENCFGTYNPESISLSCEEQAMKADKKGKDLGLSEQDGEFNLKDVKLGKVDEATGAGLSTCVHLVYQTALNNEKKDVCECSGETNVFSCFPNGINDGVKTSVSSLDVPKVGTDTALSGMGKERRDSNIDNTQLTSAVEITKVDDADDFGNVRSISGIIESRIGPEDVPSVMVQSLGERGLCSTSTDEKIRHVSKNFNGEPFSTSYEPKFEGISGNDDKTTSLGSDHAIADGDDMEIIEHVISTESCSNVPALDGQSCITLSNAKNPSYTMEELWQEKSYQSNASTPFVKEDRGSNETGMVCPSGYAHSYDIVNNVSRTSSSSIKELNEEEGKRSWNSNILLAFGSSHGGLSANSLTSSVHKRSSEVPSLVLSDNDQAFSTGNNFTGLFSSSRPNGSEPTHGIENNLNKAYGSMTWEQPNSEGAENSRINNPMTGFPNHSQPCGDFMAEFMWRTNEENGQRSGLADTSSALVQSSSCYPNFDMLSGKGANEALSIDEKFDNISDLERLKPGRIEQLEYNFQTVQASSHSEESKVLSYDGEMEEGLNSAWLEKESLTSIPNIASRREINICAWCSNEFCHEVYEAGKHTGSVGLLCPTCQANFSGQFDYL